MSVLGYVPLLVVACSLLGINSISGLDVGVKVDVRVRTSTTEDTRGQSWSQSQPLETTATPAASTNQTTVAAEPPPPLGPPTEISLFDEVRFRGSELKITLHGTECVNLTGSWQNRAKSIHTHDGCVVVYHNLGCDTRGGPWEKLWGGDNKSHSDLSDASFMSRSWSRFISSLGGCEWGSPTSRMK